MTFRVVFRVDASLAIGTGHLMRCLTLADRMRASLAALEALFICRAHPGHLGALIEKRGYKVALLAVVEGAPIDPLPAHAAWLGAGWEADAQAAIEVIEGWQQGQKRGQRLGLKLDWLVVDHYGLDGRWESRLRSQTRHLLAIDDLADRGHDCDILLDQNYRLDAGRCYDGLVPPGCRCLLGPAYALLRPEFSVARDKLKPRSGKIERIFIFFGGIDAGNETARAVKAFLALGRDDLMADVVIGSGNPHLGEVEALCGPHKNIHTHVDITDMAAYMAAADLALGAGGTATWERCALGLPSIVIALAENQRAGAEAMAAAGLIHYLGPAAGVSVRGITGAVNQLMTNSLYYRHLSEKGLAIVSPDGAAGLWREMAAIR